MYLGNEGDIFMFANNTGFMWENAHKFRAMVLFVEHRYYGQSLPFGKLDKNLTKMGYLSTEQALADFAEIIVNIETIKPKASKSPIVVFGGSYGGMLAAWFRIKYPHLSVGALAASAPIWALYGLNTNCNAGYDIMTKDFSGYSTNCSQCIRNSWSAVIRVTQTEEGRKWFSHTFKLCKPLAQNQLGQIMGWLEEAWAYLPMIDYPNPASFLRNLPAYPIKEACTHLKDPKADDKHLLEQIYRAVSVYHNYTGSLKCFSLNDDTFDADEMNAWGFQVCTELVLPFCANGKTDMFPPSPFNISASNESCQKRYGITPDTQKAILLYGGRNITNATNIIFSNGLRDPWSAGGVLQTLSPSLVAIKLPHSCHHEDLRSTGPNDPPELLAARNQEIKIIKKWINDYYKRFKYTPNEWMNNTITE